MTETPKRGPGRPPKAKDPRLDRGCPPIHQGDHDKLLRLLHELEVALNVGTRSDPMHQKDLRRIDDAAEEMIRLIRKWQGKR